MVRSPLTRLIVIAGVFGVVPAWGASSAHAVTFAGPALGVGSAPQSVAVGEFNGDSDADLAVANEGSNDVSVLLGGAGGSFAAPVSHGVGTKPLSVALGDFNGDSDADLAVVNEGSNDVSVLLGGPGGTFTNAGSFAVGSTPQSVAVGEFDGDSDADLAVVNEFSNDVSVLLGGPGGTFGAAASFAVGTSPRSVAVGQFDGDSDPDLAVANELSNDVSVLLGDAGGSFSAATSFGTGSAPTSIAVGRFNGDSDPDLAVVNELSHNVSVLLGGAGGSFGTRTDFAAGSLPDSVAVGELSGDADPDLAVANQGTGTVSVLVGGTGGSFRAPSDFRAGDGPTSVAVAEFNGDSDLDLVVTNELSNTVSILFAVPPETTIDSGPPGATNDSTPAFSFSSNDRSASFKCRADGGAFASCSSPHTVSLPDGAHTFDVRATDDAGRTDPTPARWTFVLDTVAPPVPTPTGTDPESFANDNNPFVKGRAAAGSTVRLYRAVASADCTPATLAATGTAAAFAAPGLRVSVPDNSTTTFRTSASDDAGNVSECSMSSVTYVELSAPPVPGGAPPVPVAAGPGGTGPAAVPPGKPGTSRAATPDRRGPAMAVAGRLLRMKPSGVVHVPLFCPASERGGCAGTLSLETLGPLRESPAESLRPVRRKVRFGGASFRLASGRRAAVAVRLSRRGKAIVRSLPRIRVRVIVDARDRAGNAKRIRKALILRAMKLEAERRPALP